MSMRRFLEDRGVPDADIAEAEAQGSQALRLLAMEHMLLPGENRYTPEEVAKLAEVDLDLARVYWRALGFVDVPEGVPAFTDHDVVALRGALELIERGLANTEASLQLTRVMGQAFSRITDAQVAVMRERVERQLQDGAAEEEIEETMLRDSATLVPMNDAFLSYIYRRHLAAAWKRSVLGHAGTIERGEVLAVGFADLVGFTSMARRLEDRELAELIERFERTAYDTIGSLGGRTVKMIGDEVMFVADHAENAAEIALTLNERCTEDDTLPGVRIGLAYGPVLPRQGDYFGPTVNLANRLANASLPRTILVPKEMREALAGSPAFALRRIRHRHLKGIGRVTPWALRRAR